MVKLNYKQYCLDIPNTVYVPSEDTFLFTETLDKELVNNTFESALEIGVGNAYLSLTVYDFVNKLTCIDINDNVIQYILDLRQKYDLNKLNVVKSNLFENIEENCKFDLILFNPPYVPSEPLDQGCDLEDICSCGGNKGREIIDKFLNKLPNYLSSKGVCYLLISSHNIPIEVYDILKKLNLDYKIINNKKLFFEELYILKITHKL